MMKVTVGVQIIADLYGIDEDLISESGKLYDIIEAAVKVGKLTKISSDYYQFQPRGVSGIVLLAESHLSFHTWPEHGLVTLDIYTCGDPENADAAFNYIVSVLAPTSVEYKKLSRGNLITEDVKVLKPQHVILH
jgi:S-adenosylmethionine decarboxylase